MLQEFTQQVEETAKAVVSDIHTALPGKIVSFDPEKGTAVVQPKGKFITQDGFRLEYPKITDVPVAFPFCQQSNIGMVFPVKKDDNCMIIVSEVELDEWRSGAESEASLRFDLTSAMVIPNLMLGGSAVMQEAVNQNAVIIVASGVKVTIGNGSVTVNGSVNVTGDVRAGGISLAGHTHIGNLGADTSGPQ